MQRRQVLGLGASALLATLTACGEEQKADRPRSATGTIVLGFSQVGAEGGWRQANTKSIKDAAKNANIDLRFEDANGDQKNQIAAIRSFIAQRVNVIAFSPIVETGWEEVLTEAKAAKIPVVLTDRLIDSLDTSLYTSSIGADFIAEGNQAGLWLVKEYESATGPINIVEIQGAPGAAPTKQRNQGFLEVVGNNKKFPVRDSATGQWTETGGTTAMRALLKRNDKIDVVFAQNDDMGLGAITAIEKAGKIPGKDIKIITVDATRAGLTALAKGKLNFVVECSPVIGRKLMDVVVDIYLGGTVPKRVLSDKVGFDQEGAKAVLPERVY